MPTIPATQEAEMKRIIVEASPNRSYQRPNLNNNNNKKLSMVVLTCIPSTWVMWGDSKFKANPRQKYETPFEK
jgi:hypothetical protein